METLHFLILTYVFQKEYSRNRARQDSKALCIIIWQTRVFTYVLEWEFVLLKAGY